MSGNISRAAFSGDRNQGFQLAYNSGRVDVNYHVSQSGVFFRALSLERVLTLVSFGQRKNIDLALAPPYRFGETMILFIATRLLRSTHGVLSQLLECHLLDWEA